jgi:hypothetical protein
MALELCHFRSGYSVSECSLVNSLSSYGKPFIPSRHEVQPSLVALMTLLFGGNGLSVSRVSVACLGYGVNNGVSKAVPLHAMETLGGEEL